MCSEQTQLKKACNTLKLYLNNVARAEDVYRKIRLDNSGFKRNIAVVTGAQVIMLNLP